MPRPRERGVALLAATATLAALTIITVGLAQTAIVDQQLGRNAVHAAQADALARSGIATALIVLGERDPSAPDLHSAQWTFGRQPLGAGWVEVSAEDEARRLDVQAPELPQLLAALGLDARLAPALAAPDRDKVIGPSLWDRGHGAGMDRASARRLLPHVTTSGETLVNPNTASREVLVALLDDPGLVDAWLRLREHGAIDPATAPAAIAARLTTRGQFYRVRATGGVADARRTIVAVVRLFDGADPVLVSWHPLAEDAS